MNQFSRACKLLLLWAIRLYQLTLGPLLRAATGQASICRYDPTCSHYAADALKIHGLQRGLWLALKRISRCHPWGGCGHDPVPPAQAAKAASRPAIFPAFSHHSHLKSDTKNVRS